MGGARKIAVGAVSMAAAVAMAAGLAPAAGASPSGPTAAQRQARDLGLQTAPKGGSAAARSKQLGPNPYLANLPSQRDVDYSTWRRKLAERGAERAASSRLAANQAKALGRSAAAPFVHDEEEPVGTNGSNDTRVDAEPVAGFGTGSQENPRVRILGSLADLAPESRRINVAEDNGSIRLATRTRIDGVGSVSVQGLLGNGPHGGSKGSNDFEFFKVTSRKGLDITVDLTGTPEPLDTIAVLYDASGEILALNDDADIGANPLASRLVFPVPANGDYYVLVAGFADEPLPDDPFDSGSGSGGAERGRYTATISSAPSDKDYYALRLDKGDVVGAVGRGAATALSIFRPDGVQMVGSSEIDASSIYPPNSPLPGGGNTTLAYVAEQSGTYAIRADGSTGSYDVLVEAYRPGSETDPSTRQQTIFLDFDGARLNTGIFGGPGVRDLSPFSAFIAKWGLSRSQEATLIDRITATVRENLQRDLAAKGLNDRLSVRVTNSKDSPDLFGQTNVSRVVVGGTIAQSEIPTIGIAQYIDPGNYSHEDTALVLLDTLSGSAAEYKDASLNYYLRPQSNRVAFVSTALGNVISHEIGHYIGSFHTDNGSSVHNLMDSGGGNFGSNLYGVGPDGIGGTADDEDIDFRTDRYEPFEGFTGRENTLNVSAWAFVRGSGGH